MEFPNTPQTVISQMQDADKVSVWNGAWSRFFDIYRATLRVMVSNAFFRQKWYNLLNTVIDEVVGEVAFSILKIFEKKKYDKSKGKFRQLLVHISNRRVVDFIRRSQKGRGSISLDSEDIDVDALLKDFTADIPIEQIGEEENRTYKNALFMDVYNSMRYQFEPRTCAAFEAVKLEQRKVSEVAEELGVSENVINNAVHRVVKKLRTELEKPENRKEFCNG